MGIKGITLSSTVGPLSASYRHHGLRRIYGASCDVAATAATSDNVTAASVAATAATRNAATAATRNAATAAATVAATGDADTAAAWHDGATTVGPCDGHSAATADGARASSSVLQRMWSDDETRRNLLHWLWQAGG